MDRLVAQKILIMERSKLDQLETWRFEDTTKRKNHVEKDLPRHWHTFSTTW